jgi:hypothetical protein
VPLGLDGGFQLAIGHSLRSRRVLVSGIIERAAPERKGLGTHVLPVFPKFAEPTADFPAV